MNNYFAIIFLILISGYSYSQKIDTLKYCDCIDKIESESPQLNGKYERRCNGKIIETGSFSNDQKEGEWITYSKKGGMVRKTHYTNGKLNGSVELWYPDGKPKFSGTFVNGKKNGIWNYYSEKGKACITGEYLSDKPINLWTIKDREGKKILVEYDYTSSKYIKNEKLAYHKEWDVIQNDNIGEFSIMLYPERKEYEGSAPLGGFLFASDLFVDLMELPVDFMDTYISTHFEVTIKIGEDNSYEIVSVSEVGDFPENEPMYPFLMKTNDADKLQHVAFSSLSRKMLNLKIQESLNLLTPWIFSGKTEVKIVVPYVINQIQRIDEAIGDDK